MGMLDRYKKKGGFVQLLMLIESSGRQKQDQFLALIAQESPTWENAIRQKCLSLEKILGWEESHLREVLTRVQPLTLATALGGMGKEKSEAILSCLSGAEQRKIQQIVDESRATPAEISTCVLKIVAETRAFATSGIIKLDKIDSALVIPENIEEQLQSADSYPLDLGYRGAGSEKLMGSEKGNVTPISAASASNHAENNSAEGPTKIASGHVPPAKTNATDDGRASGRPEQLREENEALKKKLAQSLMENSSLKQEVTMLRGKLEQIRRIA